MGTKSKPGEFDCYAKAGDNEPIFTLRAKDPVAPETIEHWLAARRREQIGQPVGEHEHYREVRRHSAAIACMDDMRNWQDDHDIELAPPLTITPPTFKEAKRQFERVYVVHLMRLTNGNVSLSARIAGKDRKDFYDLVKRAKVDPNQYRG